MFKKILVALLIFGGIFSVGNFANAQDVYVGTSNTTGRDCYLMTETIYSYWKGTHAHCIDATLKMVRRSDGNVQYLDYTFIDAPPIHFRNSQGFEGTADQYKTPIEWNMFWAIINCL